MSLVLPRRRILRALIYIVCLSLVLLAADLVWVQIRREIRPGFQTTRFVTPVLPDGSVDYLLAHDNTYGQGVTPENNAAVPLLLALGRGALPSNQPTDGITDLLGMPHLPEKGDYFVQYESFCHDHSATPQDDLFHPPSPPIWPVKVEPITKQWLKANEKPLALVAEASKRTRFFIPFYGGFRPQLLEQVLLPHLSLVREAARALVTRATMRLGAGDAAGFLDDVLTVHRLARLINEGGTLIDRVVSWDAIETSACEVDRLAVSSGKLSAEQLRTLAAQLSAMGEMSTYLTAIDDGERVMMLDIIQAIGHGSPDMLGKAVSVMTTGTDDRPNNFPDFLIRFWPIPCEETMREINRYCDGMIVAAGLPTYPPRIGAMKLWNEEIVKLHQRSWVWSILSPDLPLMCLMLSPGRLENRYETVRMERRLTLIALALGAYKAEHGSYPTSLKDLPCDCNDLFVERPVIYTQKDKGYLLHSVGPNMTDDNGQSDDIEANVP
jgi:hypothetical protein